MSVSQTVGLEDVRCLKLMWENRIKFWKGRVLSPLTWRTEFNIIIIILDEWTPTQLEASWNVMAHVQKPDFVFRQNGRVHWNRQGASVHSTTGSQVVRISGSNVGYTMFWGSVKSTGYPLHSPVSLSLPLPCITMCHHISTGVYNKISNSNYTIQPLSTLMTYVLRPITGQWTKNRKTEFP